MISSFLKITSFYKDFLNDYYHSNPSITELSFDEQYKHLMDQGYGYADYFPRYLEKNHGLRATEIIHNALPLQQAWAREHGSKLTGDELLLEQIIQFQPEVIMIQDSINFSAAFLGRTREKVKSLRVLMGHICAPYNPANLEAFSCYDGMLTCSEKFREELEQKEIRAFLFPHAVEASLISDLPATTAPANDIIFMASLLYRSEFHRTRIAYVEEILKSGLPLRLSGIIEDDPWYLLGLKQASWLFVRSAEGLGLNTLVKGRSLRKISLLKEMPVRNRYSLMIRENISKELLFGKEMLRETSRHAVGFNLHGEVAGDYAANLRMFEVSGAGSLLVTDHKLNIHELFEPDQEVLTYKSIEECIEKLSWAINHPVEARAIALAGQKRTLRDHSVERRTGLLYDIIAKLIS